MFSIIFWSLLFVLFIVVLHIVAWVLCIVYIWQWLRLVNEELSAEKERKKARKERAKLAKNNPDFVFIEI